MKKYFDMYFKTVSKTILILLSATYLILIITGYMSTENKLGPPEYFLIAFTILFVAGFFDNLAEFSLGKDGMKFQLNKIQNDVDDQANVISAAKVALKGLVSKYEYKHLINLYNFEHYMCVFGYIFFDEIKRLDSIGFIRPTSKCKDKGFNIIKERHEHDGNHFDLKDYMEITDEGKAYMQIVNDL